MSELKPIGYRLVSPDLGVQVAYDSEFSVWTAYVAASSDHLCSATSALGDLAKKLRDIASSIEESF
jgi:hypothetical protein